MPKVDVSSLTNEETAELLEQLIGLVSFNALRDAIVENLDADMLEELAIACEEQVQELREAENEDDGDEE